ncbi:NAD(P)H-dependent oxidoreductase [Solirubrobacter sp. CPCC 204708]|uniref:NAD(P)H-dependent oxidoreductase n=1 Tax=Solirubrobacter deserti TaxID=2282478 RepID=A0ABT4RP81_9ACTN|nr:NAD(P)H-dependent oxidoreductase [Solirubrobacter deserti]MBE2315744.1 NAD(P)H-dependent oxidoreductase [Solirubrobacter deserti]MDA0140366.1 NAD(P)H-dependent oxidoreductase [Solirubrobacter deserti]
MRVLAVSGSLRKASHNTALLRAMAEEAPEGVTFTLFDGLEAVPPFNEDREDHPQPPGLARWRNALRTADLVVFATPEYNTTIPGQLKNAVDWASRPFGEESVLWGRPVAVLGASKTGYGAMWSQADLRKALAKAGARVLDAELAIPYAHRVTGDVLRRRAGGYLADVLDAVKVPAR